MLCKPQIAFLRESILSILGVEPPSVFYIGGSDVLPPPLEKEAESAALAALEEGDEAARSLLIEHNLRLVVYISKHFENTGVNIEDLISIGTIGLIKAVNTFNAAKNIKLATYASRCIENEILMYLRKRGAQRSELSFDEPLNTDWDGNELLLSDILGTDGAPTVTRSRARSRMMRKRPCCAAPSARSASGSARSSRCASGSKAGASIRRRRWPIFSAFPKAISAASRRRSSSACGAKCSGRCKFSFQFPVSSLGANKTRGVDFSPRLVFNASIPFLLSKTSAAGIIGIQNAFRMQEAFLWTFLI